MQLASFKVDVTPPVGAQMAYDLNKKVDTPVFIRGLILDDGTSRVVIVSCDFIGIYGQTWFDWRQVIADAAGTEEGKVFLHSVHQHDSMYIAPWMNEFLEGRTEAAVDVNYCRKTLNQLRSAVGSAAGGDWMPVRRILTAERRMIGLAANRRMIDENGRCSGMRFSMCGDSQLKARPVGTIDPLLRTIAFAGAEGRIYAALHFYASHPMAAYRREMVGQDVPGVALQYAKKEFGGDVFNICMTGCAGNVTFGKYHAGDKEESMNVLGRRLGQGLVANLNHLEPRPAGRISIKKADCEFPFDPEITENNMLRQLGRSDASRTDLMRAARKLTIARNRKNWCRYPVTRLSLGDQVHILSLQGEVCVEYQIYAQSLVPEHFLACAAYGDGTYAYIPTACMYDEGGYEPEASISTPAVEFRLKAAMAEALEGLSF